MFRGIDHDFIGMVWKCVSIYLFVDQMLMLMERIRGIPHPNLAHIQRRENFIFLSSLSQGR